MDFDKVEVPVGKFAIDESVAGDNVDRMMPERCMLGSMLEYALHEAINGASAEPRKSDQEQARQDAIRWIFSDSTEMSDRFFSFLGTCDILNLEPEPIKEVIKRLLESGEKRKIKTSRNCLRTKPCP